MAFDLRITFAGLCLFVPVDDANPANRRMHVLLPKLPRNIGHGMDRHTATLLFDTAHLRKEMKDIDDVWASALMKGRTLELGGAGVVDPALCPDIVDISSVARKPIHASHLADDKKFKKLVSRVTLRSGSLTGVAPGVCWEWDTNVPRLVAHQVQWTMRIDDTQLKLKLGRLHGDELEMPVLYPLKTGGAVDTMELFVYHVPPTDLPQDPADHKEHEPEEGEEPPHFNAFFELFGERVPILRPRFHPGSGDCPQPRCPDLGGRGGSPYTCMVASARP